METAPAMMTMTEANTMRGFRIIARLFTKSGMEIRNA